MELHGLQKSPEDSEWNSICNHEFPIVYLYISLGDKRAVSQKGGFGECALVPVFVPGEHANVPSLRFSFRENIRMYPRSGFRSDGTSAKTTLFVFGKPPFCQPFWNIVSLVVTLRKWVYDSWVCQLPNIATIMCETDTWLECRIMPLEAFCVRACCCPSALISSGHQKRWRQI